MFALLKKNYAYYLLFLPLFILCGIASTMILMIAGISGIIWFAVNRRYEFVILTFIVILVLTNSKAQLFSGFDILRVVFVLFMLAFSVVIMNREGGIGRRVSYFIPFSIEGLFVSILFSPELINSILSALSYLFLVISVFTFVRYVARQHESQLFEHLIVLFIIISIVSLLGSTFLFSATFIEGGRLRGIMGNPNMLGLFCVIAYPFLDYYDFHKGDITKREILIGKGLLILCLFFSGSRTAYSSFIIYMLLTVFLFRGMSGRSITVIIGLAGLFMLFQLETLINFFPGLKNIIRPETLASASGRVPSWMIAIDQILQQPWLGGGFEFSRYYMPHFARTHGLIAVNWYGVWNSYLSFLMDVGIIGLVAYGFFVFGITKISPRTKLLIPFLGVVLFSAIFESWLNASLNPITPLFLIFFVINKEYESRF